jgi:outer membrane beta-barrel protein
LANPAARIAFFSRSRAQSCYRIRDATEFATEPATVTARAAQSTLVAPRQDAYDRKVMPPAWLRVCARVGLPLVMAVAPAVSNPAWAAPEDAVPLATEGQTETTPPGPSTRITCLDDLSPEGAQRKGVQKRDFLKRHKVEMSALAGLFAADALSSSYALAGGFAFFPAEDFGIELLAAHAPTQFRLEEPFVGFDEPRRFQSSAAFSVLGALLFSPVHAKFKFTETTIVHGDLFVVAGAGRTLHDTVQGITFQAGVGLRLYLLSRLAFRFELRDLVMPQEVLGVGRVTHNLTILGGLSFWLG